jgi:hypothetical protein
MLALHSTFLNNLHIWASLYSTSQLGLALLHFAAVLGFSTSYIVQAQAILINGFCYTEQHLPVKSPASKIMEIKKARDGDQLPTSKCFKFP